MYRDIPLGNRLLANKYINRMQTKHAKALEKIERRKKGSGTLDNRMPDTKKMRHLVRNFKKEQMTEDRNVEIERQNGQLLAKMTHIMTNPGISAEFQKAQPSRGDAVPGRSLNVEARRREPRLQIGMILGPHPHLEVTVQRRVNRLRLRPRLVLQRDGLVRQDRQAPQAVFAQAPVINQRVTGGVDLIRVGVARAVVAFVTIQF